MRFAFAAIALVGCAGGEGDGSSSSVSWDVTDAGAPASPDDFREAFLERYDALCEAHAGDAFQAGDQEPTTYPDDGCYDDGFAGNDDPCDAQGHYWLIQIMVDDCRYSPAEGLACLNSDQWACAPQGVGLSPDVNVCDHDIICGD